MILLDAQIDIPRPAFTKKVLFGGKGMPCTVHHHSICRFNESSTDQFEQACECDAGGWLGRDTFHLGEHVHRPESLFVAHAFEYTARFIYLTAHHRIRA